MVRRTGAQDRTGRAGPLADGERVLAAVLQVDRDDQHDRPAPSQQPWPADIGRPRCCDLSVLFIQMVGLPAAVAAVWSSSPVRTRTRTHASVAGQMWAAASPVAVQMWAGAAEGSAAAQSHLLNGKKSSASAAGSETKIASTLCIRASDACACERRKRASCGAARRPAACDVQRAALRAVVRLRDGMTAAPPSMVGQRGTRADGVRVLGESPFDRRSDSGCTFTRRLVP